ncbi:MAG: FISUMP domain-containing protein [Bacteroidota bacterium]|nr:FISUMP domain-containing protein [Bacteroidota bacterium]
MKKLCLTNRFFLPILALIISFGIIFSGCKDDNEFPTVSITNPANGASVFQDTAITIMTNAQDNNGSIAEVLFYIDGVNVGTASSSPFNYRWNTTGMSLGSHKIKVTAYDNEGATKSAEINIIISLTSDFTDPRDNRVYKIIKIGSQTWMAENIRFKVSGGGYWAYNGDDNFVTTYGYLYNWEATCDVCPDGWHLPSDEEWKTLEMELGMSQSDADSKNWRGTIEGGMMKEIDTTHWYSPNTGATNSSGFTALPGGYRNGYGGCDSMGFYGTFWTSTEFDVNYAWYRLLFNSYENIYRNYYFKTYGYSVRCVRD